MAVYSKTGESNLNDAQEPEGAALVVGAQSSVGQIKHGG